MAQLNSVLPDYIGRFNIIKELGKGSQGIVYLAADKQLERNVAIKTIQLEKITPLQNYNTQTLLLYLKWTNTWALPI